MVCYDAIAMTTFSTYAKIRKSLIFPMYSDNVYIDLIEAYLYSFDFY